MTTNRITTRQVSDHAINHLTQNYSAIFEIQKRISSGKKYIDPSENPTEASNIISLRSILQANENYIDEATKIDIRFSANESAFSDLMDTTTRVLRLSRTMLSDTEGPAERAVVQAEIDEIINQAIDIGNTSHEGNYIFNGYQVDVKPYELDTTTFTWIEQPFDAGQSILSRFGTAITIETNFSGESTITPIIDAMIEIRNALTAVPDAVMGASTGAITGAGTSPQPFTYSELPTDDYKVMINGAQTQFQLVDSGIDQFPINTVSYKSI